VYEIPYVAGGLEFAADDSVINHRDTGDGATDLVNMARHFRVFASSRRTRLGPERVRPTVQGRLAMFRYCSSVAFLAMWAFGCASKNASDSIGDPAAGGGYNPNTGGSTSIGGAGASNGGAGSTSINSGRNMKDLTQDDWDKINKDSCTGWTAEGEMVPANIVFIVDTSGSMKDVSANTTDGRSKWAITKTALEGALDTIPRLTSVGMLLWPNMMTSVNNNDVTNCAYCNPDGTPNPDGIGMCVNVNALVPLQKMEATGSAHRQALADTLEAVSPQGGTPMADAYNFAIDANYGGANSQVPGKKYAVLITDGQPTIQLGCEGTGEERYPKDFGPVDQSIAGAFQNSPFVRTFVIGSPGSEHQTLSGADGRGALSQAAIDGDTKLTPTCQADGGPNKDNFCHFDMSAAADFAAGFSGALRNITGQVLSCTYTVNDSQLQDYKFNADLVNVVYEVNGSKVLGDMKLVGKATTADCPEDNGWYMDPDDPNGRTIKLCPMTCDTVQQDAGAVVDIRGGCETIHYVN
jgi:hypothetical protein